MTHRSAGHTPKFKLIKEVRDDKGDTSLSRLHQAMSKVVKEVRYDKGYNFYLFCFDRSRIRNLTNDDTNLTSSSSLHEARSSSCRQTHNRRAVWLTPNRLAMARPGRKLSSKRAISEGRAVNRHVLC